MELRWTQLLRFISDLIQFHVVHLDKKEKRWFCVTDLNRRKIENGRLGVGTIS
jgi:nucleoside-triphosphatase THEP1